MGMYIVTGSSSGIGKAVANQIQAEGHRVVGIDIRDADIVADLSSAAACESVIAQISELANDGIDGLVPCAGVGPECPRPDFIPQVNFFAVVDLVSGLLPLLEKKRGAIVLISSNSSRMMEYNEDYIQALLAGNREEALRLLDSVDGQGAYGGSKQALTRWMRHNNTAFAASGVRMNAIAPGYTETGMTASGKEDPRFKDALKQFVDSIPIGRPGMPSDQANAVMFLLGDKATFISGSVLFVDGGHDASFRHDSY
jgi:NAD(P)-dependent dehydrogenase (short-subunit alcohol dehydrogenase family)